MGVLHRHGRHLRHKAQAPRVESPFGKARHGDVRQRPEGGPPAQHLIDLVDQRFRSDERPQFAPRASCAFLRTCRRLYPGGIAKCFCRWLPLQCWPSPTVRGVGFHIWVSGPHRAFTCVTACIFAGSPSDPFHRRLRRVRCLPRRFDCYWASDPSQAGLPPAKIHTHSRRTDSHRIWVDWQSFAWRPCPVDLDLVSPFANLLGYPIDLARKAWWFAIISSAGPIAAGSRHARPLRRPTLFGGFAARLPVQHFLI